MRRAVIDIGTNTVKLFVAEVTDGRVVPVLATDAPTRLGEGVNVSHRLSASAMARTVEAVARYAREAGPADIIAVTTSAVRDAVNRAEFLGAVRARTGLAVEVLSGEREAELIFRGVASDPVWRDQPLLVMDVGGGSAEFIQGRGTQIEQHRSLPVGAVRLFERFGNDDFAGLISFLRETLAAALAGYSAHGRRMIGTGGGICTVARMLAGTADQAVLSQERVRALVAQLNALPLAERKQLPGLPADRADIIVAGGATYLVAMELLGAPEVTVSVRNLRYGLLVAGAA